MAQNKQTSRRVAHLAAKLLANPSTPKRLRPVIASALAQTPSKPKPPRKKGK